MRIGLSISAPKAARMVGGWSRRVLRSKSPVRKSPTPGKRWPSTWATPSGNPEKTSLRFKRKEGLIFELRQRGNSLPQGIKQRIFSSQAGISADSAHNREILLPHQGTEQ